MADKNKGSSNRGFASMDKDEQRKIASKGGKSSHGGRKSDNQSSNQTNRQNESS